MPIPCRVLLAACVPLAWLAGGAIVEMEMRQAAMAQPMQLDMDAIFRCAAKDTAGVKLCASARELILQNCAACHTFVPIVMQQFDANAWRALIERHRPRVPQLSEDQLATIRGYLIDNFNPDNPPPPLPAELLKNWLPGAV